MDSNKANLLSEKDIYSKISLFMDKYEKQYGLIKIDSFLSKSNVFKKYFYEKSNQDVKNELNGLKQELNDFLIQEKITDDAETLILDFMKGLMEIKNSESDRFNLSEEIGKFCNNRKLDFNNEITEKLDYFLNNSNEFFKILKIPGEQYRLQVELLRECKLSETPIKSLRFITNSKVELIRIVIDLSNMIKMKIENYEGIISNNPNLITYTHFLDGLLDIDYLSKFKNAE